MSSAMQDDRAKTSFICALVERFLENEGLDIGAAEVVAAGLRAGRSGASARRTNGNNQVYIIPVSLPGPGMIRRASAGSSGWRLRPRI